MDSGTAYGRPRPTYDATLVEGGPGTPGGEMLRRYWHPIAGSAQVTSRPRNVRVLGEDLIVFRDLEGRPGLLYPLYRTPKGQRVERMRFDGKTWDEISEDEHQRMPNDYEAQVGQGAITLHPEERLTSTDRGVVMFRRLLREQIEAVCAGRDPLGVAFEAERARVQVQAGNFLLEEGAQ